MNTREKTALLTKVGFLWLKYLGCTLVAPEIPIITNGLRDPENKLDKHTYIDLVGIYSKYIPREERVKKKVKYISSSGQRQEYNWLVDKETVSRGVEIKVSRADFKNGFIHVGCDYHYLLIPKGLVTRDEVTKGIGIIEVDLDAVQVCSHYRPGVGSSYWLRGVELTRRPTRSKMLDVGNEAIVNHMAYANTGYIKYLLQGQLAVNVDPWRSKDIIDTLI